MTKTMQKKAYQAPATTAHDMQAEGLIAASAAGSVGIGNQKSEQSTQWSRKQSWSSDNWTQAGD